MDISFLEKLCYSLGLGKISNIEFNGELQGIVPSKFWKFKRFGNLWYIGDSANLMIGQGYLTCTPLQLCTMVGSIASGNLMYLSTLDSTGHAIAEKNTLVSEKNLNIIRSSMFEVVNSPYSGTAYPSIGKKYKDLRISGKTGTVQISSGQKHKNHSVFVGFAPYDKPKYAVSVIGEFMGYGSSFAAPLAGKIFDFLKEN
jgi:penicillin-binding protein 2